MCTLMTKIIRIATARENTPTRACAQHKRRSSYASYLVYMPAYLHMYFKILPVAVGEPGGAAVRSCMNRSI